MEGGGGWYLHSLKATCKYLVSCFEIQTPIRILFYRGARNVRIRFLGVKTVPSPNKKTHILLNIIFFLMNCEYTFILKLNTMFVIRTGLQCIIGKFIDILFQ